MFFGRKNEPVSWLVVFLGNPGDKYDNTRHNAGFRAADVLEKKTGERLKKIKYQSLLADLELGGQRILAMKPQTYMNLSGEAVGEAARFYKVPADHVLVISDDIALPAGKLRIRPSGSAGGHNGLKNIIAHLGTDQFPRIKVGVGIPQQEGYDTVDWVIGKPRGEDAKAIMAALDKAAEAVPFLIQNGTQKAMNRFNG